MSGWVKCSLPFFAKFRGGTLFNFAVRCLPMGQISLLLLSALLLATQSKSSVQTRAGGNANESVPNLPLPVRGNATLDVVVTQPGGESIPGVKVSVRQVSQRTSTLNRIDAVAEVQSVSESNGHATFRNLPAGLFVVQAQREGFYGIRSGGRRTATREIEIVPAQNNRSLSLNLVPDAVIRVTVRGPDGQAAPNVTVRVSRKAYFGGRPYLQGTGVSGPTDDRGAFRIFGLEPGDYYLTARSNLQTGAALNSQSFVYSYYPGTTVSSRAEMLTAMAGMEVEAKMSLPPTPTFQVSLKVLGPPRTGPDFGNVSFTPVFFYGPQEFTLRPYVGPGTAPRAVILKNGPNENDYEIGGIPPGRWYVYPVVRIPGPREDYPTGLRTLSGRIAVDISDHDVAVGSVSVGGPDIRGRIVAAPGSPQLREDELKKISIAFYPQANVDDFLLASAQVVSRTPAANGEFLIRDAPASDFRIATFGLPPNSYISDIRIGTQSVLASPVVRAADNAIDAIELIVGTGTGKIHGSVRGLPQNSTLETLSQIQVAAMPLDTSLRRNPAMFRWSGIDLRDGSYDLKELPPGQYRLIAVESASFGDSMKDPGFVQSLDRVAITARVETGQTTAVDLSLTKTNP
jgi:hypothetical protein